MSAGDVQLKCDDCRGRGQVECECCDCGHRHDADCGECDGRGYITLSAEDAADLREGEKPRDRANRRWREVRAEFTFEPTDEGFTAAFRQMFGADPRPEYVTQFLDNIRAIADAAGVNLQRRKAVAA